MRSLRLGCALSLAVGSVALAASDQLARSGQVDWPRLGDAFAAFVDYPSAEKAKAVRALLPTTHVAYDGSAAEKITSEIINRGLPMLERQVEARDAEAVRLAFDLFVVTDGASAEELDIMLGKLIRIDPKLFLAELKPREQRIGTLGGLVANEGDVYVDRVRAQCLELRSRISSLERVTEGALLTVKERCLAELKEATHVVCRQLAN